MENFHQVRISFCHTIVLFVLYFCFLLLFVLYLSSIDFVFYFCIKFVIFCISFNSLDVLYLYYLSKRRKGRLSNIIHERSQKNLNGVKLTN